MGVLLHYFLTEQRKPCMAKFAKIHRSQEEHLYRDILYPGCLIEY